MTTAETMKHAPHVRAWCDRAWPVSAKSAAQVVAKAWGEYGAVNIRVETFRECVKLAGYEPQRFGEIFLLRFPGPSPALAAGAIKCMGV